MGKIGNGLRALNIRKDKYTKEERQQTHMKLKEMKQEELDLISNAQLGGASEEEIKKIREQEKKRRREFAEEEKRKNSGTVGLSQSKSFYSCAKIAFWHTLQLYVLNFLQSLSQIRN